MAQALDFRQLPRWFKTYLIQDRFHPSTYVPFEVNSAQKEFLELCAQIQDQHQLVWIIAIKPRRVGLSRVISGIGTTMAFRQPGLEGVVMAQLGSTLGKIMRSIEVMAKGLPTHSHADYESSAGGKRQAKSVTIGRGKTPSILAGSKALATGEGRGDAASFMQLTEAAHYPLTSPFSAVLPLVPRALDTFIGVESTPNPERRGLPFKQIWDEARWVHETRRDTLFVRYFCPWMRDPYAFSDPAIAKDAPIDEDEKILLKAGIGRAQIAWRRQEIKGRYRGRKEQFEIENPSDPLSCFSTTEMPAFSLEERAWARRTVQQPPGVGFGRFIGSGPNGLEHPIRIQLAENDPWRIYEEPQKGCEYYLGVDAARGFDAFSGGDERRITDFAAVVVINGSTSAVAAVMEARLPPDRVAREVALAGKFYRTLSIGQYHYALLNIAITDGFGNEILRRMHQDFGYPIHRFLRWRGRDDRIHGRPSQSIGWIDTQATNQLRLDVFRVALSNQQFLVRDYRLAEQIQSASMTPTGDAEDYRGHDDVLDAAMYAWIARDFERPRAIVRVDQTETIQSRAMIRLANDQTAVFNNLWNNVQKFAHPVKQNPVEQVVDHINRVFT